jgi:pimeloyl-ACP methyl ester carboxylesterase
MWRCVLTIICLVFSQCGAHAELIARLVPQRTVNCDSPCGRTAVIFIHGITGSRETWGNPEGDLYWPNMLSTESDLRNGLDIYQIDYDSTTFSGPAVVPIVKALETQLDDLLRDKKYSKVVFIAHSLGGMIVRSYLLHVKARFGHGALSRFRMVITLGTPNEGSSLASIAQLATFNEQIRVLRPIDVNDFDQLLNKTMGEIQLKHEGCLSLRTFSAFEKVPVIGLGLIVTEQSATVDAFAKIGFDKNHLQLPKPTSSTDPVYKWATDLVSACVNNDSGVCPTATPQSHCTGTDFRP